MDNWDNAPAARQGLAPGEDDSTLIALPGSELVLKGLRDLRRGVSSVEAQLVQVEATNLRLRGLDVPPAPAPDSPEHRLYDHFQEAYGNEAHSRSQDVMNAWLSLNH